MTAAAAKPSAHKLLAWLRQQGKFTIPPLVATTFLLILWEVICRGEKPALPPPSTVVKETWELIVDPFFDRGGTDKGLARQILVSLQRVAIGYSLSSISGIAVGILIGSNAFFYRALDPIFQVLRTVPPLAWLPISLAVFQKAEPSAIFLIYITSIWPILLNTAIGVQQVPQDYRNVAKVLQLGRLEYFFTILIPSAAPFIFTGLRIAVGLSWLAIVAAEIITGGVGIGSFIWDSYNSSRISAIIVSLFYVGIVGLFLDKLIFYIGKFVVQSES